MNGNGAGPTLESKRLRWLWLGGSILSERAGDLVATNRLVIRALIERGQEIEYLEPANHPAFMDGLKQSGSGFYRSFLTEFPEIRYRRYDMPRSHERDVWLSREAALVDVVVVESGAPAEVFDWLERVDSVPFVRVLVDGPEPVDPAGFDLVLASDGAGCRYEPVATAADAADQADRLLAAVIDARVRLVPEV